MSTVPATAKQIFLEAIEKIDPAVWPVFVTGACRGNAELHRQVEELLKAHQQEDSLFDIPPTEDARRISEPLGESIGKYKLLQKIGEGGFGVVYMAEQTWPVRRNVALKIIKPGMDSKEVIARFEVERQALAMMDHPNIAKVLDGGETDTGHPYFVMELVKGIPLTKFCDENKLDTRTRLGLFKDVCNAIQHAHQKGIIHRDIKPSNVMVTLHDGKPVPKVIDFGVSKAISQQLTTKTLFTQYGQMVGTPQYMSPEQAEMSGLDIDTRSDIYSLGVLLYELLTGTTPLDPKRLRQTAYAELQRLIREDEPPRPSRRLSTLGEQTAKIVSNRGASLKALHSILQGELDWIVMKALDKDRNRRYDTAKGFALDIECHLANKPVAACPPSTAYLLRKTLQRNRTPILTTLAFVALLCLSLVATVLGLWHQSLLRANAERSSTDALAAKHEVEAKSQELEVSNEKYRSRNYAFSIEAAFHAWRMGSLEQLEALLDACQPTEDEKDLRGFEWRLLRGILAANMAGKQPIGNDTKSEYGAKVVSVCFSPDSRYMLFTLGDGAAYLRDISRGTEIEVVNEQFEDSYFGRNSSCCFFKDGKRFALGYGTKDSGKLEIWELGGKEIARRTRSYASTGEVTSLAATRKDELIVSCESIGTSVISIATGEEKFSVHGRWASCSTNERWMVTCGYGDDAAPSLLVWDLENGELLDSRPTANQPMCPTFIGGDSAIIVGDASGTWRWHWNGTELSSSADPITWRRISSLYADSNWILLGGVDLAAAQILRLDTLRPVKRFLHKQRILALSTSPDGRWLATASLDKSIRLWDLKSHLADRTESLPHWSCTIAVSDDGTQIAMPIEQGAIKIWNPSTQECEYLRREHRTDGPKSVVSALAFADRGQQIVAGHEDGTLRIWDIGSKECLQEFHAHDLINSVDCSRDAKWIATCGRTKLMLWSRENYRPQLISGDADSEFAGVQFSPDGKFLAAGLVGNGKRSNAVCIWDLQGVKKKTFLYSGHVLNLAWSSNGKKLSIAGRTDEVKVIDLENDSELVLPGNGNWLTCAQFSSDGERIAAASPAGEIKFWRLPGGDAAGSMVVDNSVRQIRFGPDGNTLFWASMTGQVGYWKATSQR